MHRDVQIALFGVGLLAAPLFAQDWENVDFVTHSTLQAVQPDGRSAYQGGFPLRVVGIALLNTEDWLDPTPAYTPAYVPYAMGGEAELFVQALDRSTLDVLGVEYYDPDDFGGTAAWMGQNYGNLPFKGDPYFSYTDAEWTAELGRLNWFGGDSVTDPIRAGDLVEIRARAGLHYEGKLNINEQHDKDPAKDFEVVRLAADIGLPAPALITLADLKYPDDTDIFDATRATGGERYQTTRVQLQNVWIDSSHSQSWLAGDDLWVTDGTRTLRIQLGANPAFDGTAIFEANEPFDVVGVLNQAATDGTYSTDGYYLIALKPTDFFSPPPAVVAVDSVKNHGTAGELAIDLPLVDGVEPRVGGPTQLVVAFDRDVYGSGGPPVDDVAVSSGTVEDVTIAGNVVTANLSGVPDATVLTVAFPGIESDEGQPCTDTLCIRVLAGDVNGDGEVSIFDLVTVRDNTGLMATEANCRGDVNGDGGINIFDLVTVRDQTGGTVGSCP